MFSFRSNYGVNDFKVDFAAELGRRQKNVLGPALGKRQLFFIDDVHLARRDASGYRPALELLREWIELGGWYGSGEDVNFHKVVDSQLLLNLTVAAQVRIIHSHTHSNTHLNTH